jgi:hypothetical protein
MKIKVYQSFSDDDEELVSLEASFFDEDNSSSNSMGGSFRNTFGSLSILLYRMPKTLPVTIPPTIMPNKIKQHIPKYYQNYLTVLIYKQN